MTNRYTEILARAATQGVGDPRGFNGGDKPVIFPLRRVRVLVDGWFGPGRQPVTVGEQIRLPAPDALDAVRLGRAEFI